MSVSSAEKTFTPRHNWSKEEANDLYQQPLMDLLLQAQLCTRQYFPANEVQLSTLLSIKTGACPEDCRYCSQSGHYKTRIEKEKLLSVAKVVEQAEKAKAQGASRFCMGAAWRSPPAKAMSELKQMIGAVKNMGLETCLTAGMLDTEQAKELREAGLDYYNHNLDTSEEYYDKVVTTRTYEDRLNTLAVVHENGIKTCCGGILGLGEATTDRLSLLVTLANLQPHPDSVPLNLLVPIAGTPFANKSQVDPIDFVRTVAVARLMMPGSMVRLSAGRGTMDNSLQALCFMAGANSIHYGEKLLTTPLPGQNEDLNLLQKLGIKAMQPTATSVANKVSCATT